MADTSVIQVRDATANPAPLGLLAFGMTTVLLNLHNAGFYGLGSTVLAMGIFYGGIAQVIAGIMEWRKGNTFGTTAFLSYGLFWLTLVGVIVLPKLGWTTAPDQAAMPAYLAIWGLFTGVMFVGTLRLNRALQVVFGTLTLLFFLLAWGDYAGAGAGFTHFTGYEGIVCGLSAMYTGLAQVLNEVFGRTVLGLGPVAAAAAPSLAAEPLAECRRSSLTQFVSAEHIESAAAQQYRQMLQQASRQSALGKDNHPQVIRLRAIAERIKPFTPECNERARQWNWEVNLLGSKELNAFCMPGGKIAFYYGILQQLQLDDDEVAMIMGHEISHALLEHARERVGKTNLTNGVIELGSALLGLGSVGRTVAGLGGQLLTLRFSRENESEADALGLVLAARAGYNPQAGVTLWRKMLSANKGAPPQWLSTHPSGESRISEIEARLPRVEPMYAAASKPPQRFAPPPPPKAA